MLNCYTGNDDAIFLKHLHEFESKMLNCLPEPEDIADPVTVRNYVVNDEIPTTPGAATPAEAAATAVAGSTAKQGVGVAGAVSAMLISSRASPHHRNGAVSPDRAVKGSSKRKNWQQFL